MRLTIPVLVGLLTACSGPARPAANNAPQQLSAEFAPVPYTPEQIRWSHPEGTHTTYLVQTAGLPEVMQETIWTDVDADGCSMEALTVLPDQTAVEEPEQSRATWVELRDHAAFPVATTTLTEDSIETPAGSFDCWLYTLTAIEEGANVVSRFWFDRNSAGSPVIYERVRGDETIFRMTLIDHNRRPL